MTRHRHHRKKKPASKESAKSKAPKSGSRGVPVPLKNNKPTVAPKEQVGLLVTVELTKAIEECRNKVTQIVKGCRAANRRFR